MTTDSLAEFLGDKLQLIFAGFFGGLMRWITLRERWQDGLLSLLGGTVCAAYLGPAAIPLFEPALRLVVVEPDARLGVGGFLIGLGGVVVTGFLLDLWKLRALMGAVKGSDPA